MISFATHRELEVASGYFTTSHQALIEDAILQELPIKAELSINMGRHVGRSRGCQTCIKRRVKVGWLRIDSVPSPETNCSGTAAN
jgi:hypothetical protein